MPSSPDAFAFHRRQKRKPRKENLENVSDGNITKRTLSHEVNAPERHNNERESPSPAIMMFSLPLELSDREHLRPGPYPPRAVPLSPLDIGRLSA